MISQNMNATPRTLEPTSVHRTEVGGLVITRLSYFCLPPFPAVLADSCKIAFAEQNRSVWDTPEEDAAWQWLQPEQ
jgi:hypothetical protein